MTERELKFLGLPRWDLDGLFLGDFAYSGGGQFEVYSLVIQGLVITMSSPHKMRIAHIESASKVRKVQTAYKRGWSMYK